MSVQESTKQALALGREHYERGEFESAVDHLEQVVDSGVRFADVYNMLGLIYHSRDDFGAACDAFRNALTINPGYTEAALHLAVTLNELGKYDEARVVYRNARSHSKSTDAGLDRFVKGKIANLHVQVAQAYNDAGAVSEAVAELRKAVLLCPEYADLRMRLATLHRQRGDLEAAAHQLEQAVALRSNYVAARLSLGVVRLAQGDVESAVFQWRAVLDVEPEHRAARMYLRTAEGLGEVESA